eukprot:SAG11_NODE_4032_length_2097_cov_2.919920_2_plen_248_part_00
MRHVARCSNAHAMGCCRQFFSSCVHVASSREKYPPWWEAGQTSAMPAAAAPRVLFVHGLESGVHGLKARFLDERFSHFCCVGMPKSSTAKACAEDYDECLQLQREALGAFKPDVIVGSSFGAAICLDLIGQGDWRGPAVLLCHAFRRVKPDARMPRLLSGVPYCLVHGKRDAVVPPEHSRALLEQALRNGKRKGGDELVRLVEADDTHGLKTVCGVRVDAPDSEPLPRELQLDCLVRDVWEVALSLK